MSYQNILVAQVKNIGDLLLATGAIAHLREIYPAAKITLLTESRVAAVFRGQPLFDEVLALEYESKKTSWRKMLAQARQLKERRFDCFVSLDFKNRPSLLAWLAGIPVRISGDGLYKRQPYLVRKLYTKLVPVETQFRSHQSQTFLHIAEGLTGRRGQARPVVEAAAANREQAAALLAAIPRRRGRVAFCVRGTHPEKNWPPERFAAVMRALAAEDYACCVIGAPGDKAYVEEQLWPLVPGTGAVNLCGETEMLDLLPLMAAMDLLITVDTGAMHFAATTGVPMIALFQCTNPLQWGPLDEAADIFYRREAVAERFGVEEQADSRFHCVEEITAAAVLTLARKKLAARGN